ncbi:hypothetical protein [Pseudomonas phage Njord]|uniref:Uncharacterized protein n=1 Tax=Pseudomonas phage Njord TaxID=2163985 RepID=A0A2S1GMM4_9CAUD|nr:hypothetical protein HOT08_gp15 [Pseudomonas phage Njord]AWD90603.1 hypothetical protein [Pseudomonas phage Njord]
MKARLVQLILAPQPRTAAAAARRANGNDPLVFDADSQDKFLGPVFEENGTDTTDLHVVYRDGFVCVNFIDENKERVNYDYPLSQVNRVKRIA